MPTSPYSAAWVASTPIPRLPTKPKNMDWRLSGRCRGEGAPLHGGLGIGVAFPQTEEQLRSHERQDDAAGQSDAGLDRRRREGSADARGEQQDQRHFDDGVSEGDENARMAGLRPAANVAAVIGPGAITPEREIKIAERRKVSILDILGRQLNCCVPASLCLVGWGGS